VSAQVHPILARIHSDMWRNHEIKQQVILTVPFVPLVWIEICSIQQKPYTCPYEKKQRPARIGLSKVTACFGGTGGQAWHYVTMEGPRSKSKKENA